MVIEVHRGSRDEKAPVLRIIHLGQEPQFNFDTVRKIGLALPGVEESTAYGSPRSKVHGKLLASVLLIVSADRVRLRSRRFRRDRAELLAAAPDVYYVTTTTQLQRRVGSPVPRTPDVPCDLLGDGSQVVTAHEARRPPSREPPQPA